jgi:hypothetical protein
VKDEQIDDVLKKAAQAPRGYDPKVLGSVTASIKSSLRPIRPLPPQWLTTGVMLTVCAAISFAGALRAGFFGFAKMDLLERSLVFPTVVGLACLAATALVHQMIPASRRRASTAVLSALIILALLAVFASLFRDHGIVHFFSAGLACLATGVLYAIPAGLLSWLVIRRGFAVNPAAAGWVAGILAGLAGLGMLELHCPNFEAAHILVWHIAVVPVSAALGASVGWAIRLAHGNQSLVSAAPRAGK